MKCVICRTGETEYGKTTVTLQRESTVVLIKDVPAQICRNCGEYYLDEPVAAHVYAEAEKAVERRVEVEILRCAA
ncbi:MAG: type II toxin-antitoxin system MqsA family antitoxin [Nitrospirae bacterium]|nr:type II toxin-antitoxin system MqsA family antitoxin [Nitrospirota bacterium]